MSSLTLGVFQTVSITEERWLRIGQKGGQAETQGCVCFALLNARRKRKFCNTIIVFVLVQRGDLAVLGWPRMLSQSGLRWLFDRNMENVSGRQRCLGNAFLSTKN